MRSGSLRYASPYHGPAKEDDHTRLQRLSEPHADRRTAADANAWGNPASARRYMLYRATKSEGFRQPLVGGHQRYSQGSRERHVQAVVEAYVLAKRPRLPRQCPCHLVTMINHGHA